MRKLLVFTIVFLLFATVVIPAMIQAVKAEDPTGEEIIDDPFTYNPATYSATVSPGGSTSVSVSLGISGTGQPLTYPVTTTGWNTPISSMPPGWTFTPSALTTYSWGSSSSTVSDTLTVNVPNSASPGLYTFTAFLKPGDDSSSPKKKTVGAGTGIAFIITVPDTTPPVITHTISGTSGDNGWYTSDVTVTWTATDAESTITSTSGTNPITINSDSAGVTVSFSATSGGGTSTDSVTIKRDATPPTITGSASPGPNTNGWNNQDVTVTFSASDDLSGIASVTDPMTLTTEGSGQSVTGTATDNAGNTASATVSGINIDKTPPTITGSASPVPNANGWNNQDVTVTFSASDDLSGIASVTDPVTLTTDGSGQSVTGTATDNAGNTGSATVSGINIDKTAPMFSLTVPMGVLLNQPGVFVTWTASDALSGIDGDAGGSVQVDTTTVGEKSGIITVYDKAGNPASESWNVVVGYNAIGFLQPINMDGSSIFKLGSTVPTKFQLKDYYNNYVSIAVANLKTAQISDNTVGDDIEAISTSAATTGSLFRYDMTSNQYIFNLGTKTLTKGSYQIKAVLDSGQTIQVVISLR